MTSPSGFEFLKACDPLIGNAVERVGPLEERPQGGDHFAALCDIIIGQQLSVASARAIRNRFTAHFGEQPVFSQVLELSDETAKTLGLSKPKANYLRNLALHISEGKLEVARLESLSDEEIRQEIIAVKGLGPWSADIFLMFHLNRPDILPVGDLGIQEAMRRLHNLEARPTPAEMEKLAEPWRPHRTLASRYLWRWFDMTKKDN